MCAEGWTRATAFFSNQRKKFCSIFRLSCELNYLKFFFRLETTKIQKFIFKGISDRRNERKIFSSHESQADEKVQKKVTEAVIPSGGKKKESEEDKKKKKKKTKKEIEPKCENVKKKKKKEEEEEGVKRKVGL